MSLPPLLGDGTPTGEPPPGSVVGDTLENAIELKEVEGLSQGQIVRRRFFRHRGAISGLCVIFFLTVVAYSSVGFSIGPLTVPGWWQWDHAQLTPMIDRGRPTTAGMIPWGEHPFGQDTVGRDVFALVMKGTQTSITVMIIIGLVAGLVGMSVGAFAGFYRGNLDQGLMRLTDLIVTFPVLVIGAVLGRMFERSPFWLLALFLGLITWPTLARLVRGEFLTLREREFVDAARVSGASTVRIIRKHMLPNAMGVIIVNTTLLMSAAVLLETALSFLGFGINPPNVSLGRMIADYQSAFDARPWLFWWPGLCIILIALSVNFIGDGLRDAFDPRQKRIPSARQMAKAAEKSQDDE